MSRVHSILMCCLLLALLPGAAQTAMVSGDANNDGMVNITDAVFIVQYIFNSGPAPINQSYTDVTADCLVNITDATTIIGFIFGGDPVSLERGCPSEVISPGCTPGTSHSKVDADAGTALDDWPGTMYAEVLGNDLYLHHIGAKYQCCLGYLVEFEVDGFNITATESDTGYECDCICEFNLSSVLYDLEAGEYTVALIGIYGQEVGTETVVIDGDYGLISYDDSGCLDMTATYDPPDVDYLYDNGELTMLHHNAWYNCGSLFMVHFTGAGNVLRFYEINISPYCAYCLCYFEINATVVGIEPGTYTIEIWGQDCLSPLQLVDTREVTLE